MNDKFFPELARRLKREGVDTGSVEKDCLPVLVDGQKALWVQSWGGVILNAGVVNDPAVNRTYDTVAEISAQVREYTEAMAAAPPLVAEGLHEGFRLLADFNGVILAGRELERDWGYQFVTWTRSPDHAAVAHGHYYENGYEEAKLDFACRTKGAPQSRFSGFVGRGGARKRTQFSPQAETKLSGLCPDEVQESRQFTDEQLTELYRCIHETLDSEYPISEEQRSALTAAAEQIERSVGPPQSRPSGFVGRGGARERTQFSPQAETELSGLCPDEDERMEQSNLRELDAAQGALSETQHSGLGEDGGPAWEMTP